MQPHCSLSRRAPQAAPGRVAPPLPLPAILSRFLRHKQCVSSVGSTQEQHIHWTHGGCVACRANTAIGFHRAVDWLSMAHPQPLCSSCAMTLSGIAEVSRRTDWKHRHHRQVPRAMLPGHAAGAGACQDCDGSCCMTIRVTHELHLLGVRDVHLRQRRQLEPGRAGALCRAGQRRRRGAAAGVAPTLLIVI